MTAGSVDVQVRAENGIAETLTRTLYFSHYGPIVTMEGLGWTVDRAISIREANESNDDDHRQILACNRARSLEEFQQAHAGFMGMAGYPIGTGTSFLLALEFGREGPRAKALLTYGQSEDPNSRHFWDQTELFSRKAWRPVRFSEESIRDDLQEEIIVRGEKSS